MRFERNRAKSLERFMGTVRLAKIKGETIQNYQATRLKEGVSKRTLGMELELLRPLLKKVKRCERAAEDVKIATGQELIPCALTPQEKTRLFRVAESNPRRYRALYVSVIAVNTRARKHEILHARFQDIDLDEYKA